MINLTNLDLSETETFSEAEIVLVSTINTLVEACREMQVMIAGLEAQVRSVRAAFSKNGMSLFED